MQTHRKDSQGSTLDDVVARYENPADRELIRHAYDLAQQGHKDQARKSGEPYIIHPVQVARFLADLGFDASTIVAALLHDLLEDTAILKERIEQEFGHDVAFLVDGVTKLSALTLRTRATDLQTESLKKMFFAMAEDLRVIIIKLADRLHNMRTIRGLDAASRIRFAHETMEIYGPIAGRLGMGRLRGELDDLAFPFAYPAEHAWLKKTVRGKYESRLHYIERAAPVVKRHLQDAGVQVLDIHARAKRMWSLYQKLKRYDMNPDKVLDLVALRIIVPDIKSCYEALGVIHAHYPPMPGRIKDYIALPKPNGYRSLHTTVFCEKGQVAEIQIRTPEMHDHAENGVASHWAYKENKKNGELAWVNQLKNVLRGIKTSQGMADLKIDFFKNRIFVLTPHGDVKDLPEGATPVDFAYAVHSEIGNRLMGAIVNGKLEPIDHTLQSGDVVEIMKSKEPKPSKGWLRFVKTTQAEKHIRSWFRRHNALPEVGPRETSEVQPRRMPRKGRQPVKDAPSHPASALIIAGQSGLHYRLGKCCSPAPGSVIIGYLTVSRGVTVHAHDCANIKAAEERRLLDATWQ